MAASMCPRMAVLRRQGPETGGKGRWKGAIKVREINRNMIHNSTKVNNDV